MLKWCPCMGWCLTESSSGEKVLLTSMATPAYNVRRISSFGQTVINDSGEEEEIARHGSIPVTNGKSNSHPAWSASAVPVQPGITKSDVSRMHKMASIPEMSSPKQRNRLKKCYSDEKTGEMSPLRTRKKVPTPQEFAEISCRQDNDGDDTTSIVSETNSELSLRSKFTDDDKAKSSAPEGSTPELVYPTITVETKVEKEKKGSIFGLVKSIKSNSDKPKSSISKVIAKKLKTPTPVPKITDDEPKTPISLPTTSTDKPTTPILLPKIIIDAPKTPLPEPENSRRTNSPLETLTPKPKPRNSIPQTQTPTASRRNSATIEDSWKADEERKTPSLEMSSLEENAIPKPPARIRKCVEPLKDELTDESVEKDQKHADSNDEDLQMEEKTLSIRDETDQIEEDDEADDERTLSRTNSISTTQIDDLDEVILDDSKDFDSSQIAKQFGLDLSLYDNDINTNIGLSSSKRDDQLSANISIAKLHFTTHLDKDTLQISLEKIEGLGGIGPKNDPFDLLLKLGLIKSSHIYSTKPTLSNKPMNQNFSIHVKDLAHSILRISVYNSKWVGSHDALGHALFPVSKCGHSISHHTVNVSPKSDLGESAGIIEVSFRLDSKVVHVILHKVFDILPAYRGYKVYTKVSQFILSKKIKEKTSKTESAEKGYISLDFESKFKADALPDQHMFIMISLKKKSENNKLFKNDKTLGRVYLGPLFYNGNKINLWGQGMLEQRIITHNFTLYL